MKHRAVFLLFSLFATALFASIMSDYGHHVDRMSGRLDASLDELGRARLEVERLREENREHRRLLDDGVADTRAAIRALEARLEPTDTRSLYTDILAPSVQITGKGGVGGGTILYSRPGHTYVITAYHVVQKAATKDSEGRPATIDVRLYDERGTLLDTVDGALAAHDLKKDLALLRLRTDRTFPNVARLASRDSLRTVRVFDPIYAVGCPLGHDPLPTRGEIATLRKDVSGENFWMMNAPTIYGNSGGGIFHRETRELIGVSAMVCTYDGVVSTPVPHLGILVSLETVYDWLDRVHYGFVYDPGTTREACERSRRAAVIPPPLPVSAGAQGK